MLNRNHQEIQELAYYLWVSEEKPDGQSCRHWEMAVRKLEEQGYKKTRSTDPSEAKGEAEPAQPDQT